MPKIQRNEISVLNESERKNLQNHLVNNLNNTNIGILLTMYSGMRIGEICALKWSDIDLQSGIIRISKTVQRINDKIGSSKTKIIVGSPKSRTSEREIPIPNCLVNILNERRQNENNYISFRNSQADRTENNAEQILNPS